jgi:replicative DNA helicase
LNVDSLRLPPHSVEAEQAVLGGLLLDNAAFDRVSGRLCDEDFYRRDHRLIFRGIAELVERSEPADAVTLADHLGQTGRLEDAGGLAYLGSLARDTPTAANIGAYADIVHERAVLRRLIEIGGEIAASAHDTQGATANQLIEAAEQRVFELAERGQRRTGVVTLKSILPATIDRIDTLYNAEGELTGVPTGFEKLDKMTAGLQAGDLIIVAGRPSMGKTSLAINMAEYAAIRHQVHTLVFSMEMSAEALAMRLISSIGGVNHSQLRAGTFADEDWSRINHAVSQMTRRADLHRRNARAHAGRAALALAAAEARARTRSHRHRLPPAHAGAGDERESRDGNLGDLALREGAREGAEGPRDRVVAAQPQRGAASGKASGHVGSARVGRTRAGRGRHCLHLS